MPFSCGVWTGARHLAPIRDPAQGDRTEPLPKPGVGYRKAGQGDREDTFLIHQMLILLIFNFLFLKQIISLRYGSPPGGIFESEPQENIFLAGGVGAAAVSVPLDPPTGTAEGPSGGAHVRPPGSLPQESWSSDRAELGLGHGNGDTPERGPTKWARRSQDVPCS